MSSKYKFFNTFLFISKYFSFISSHNIVIIFLYISFLILKISDQSLELVICIFILSSFSKIILFTKNKFSICNILLFNSSNTIDFSKSNVLIVIPFLCGTNPCI